MKNPSEMNRFEQVDAARKKSMTEIKKPITHQDRVAEREAQRQNWVNPNGDNKHGATRLDDAAQAAKEAFEADKKARQQAAATPKAAPIGDQEGYAIGKMWGEQKSGWVGTPYNAQVLREIMDAFRLPITFAGLDQAFEYGKANRHFEAAVRHRGQSAPVPFVPSRQAVPVEQEVVVIKPVRIQQEVPRDEYNSLLSLPLEELRAKARAGMSHYNPAVRKDK